MKKYIFPILGIVSMTLFATFWYFEKRVDQEAVVEPSPERQAACEQHLIAAIFPDDGSAEAFMEACLRGEPVLPSDQDEPPFPDEGQPSAGNPTGPYVGAGCAIGGCSSQICGEAGEVEDIATTCEWREEYACYAVSRCERQANGQCGWTETDQFNQCLTEAAALERNEIIY
ncbi:MAG: hypothetical protein WDZ56_01595 [Candidatus Paceibacterota bacterium]